MIHESQRGIIFLLEAIFSIAVTAGTKLAGPTPVLLMRSHPQRTNKRRLHGGP